MAANKDARILQCQFFLDGSGIDREVITHDITTYLGRDTLVKPGSLNDKVTGAVRQGYYITAYRPPTTSHVEQLKRDSSKWKEHLQRLRRQTVNTSEGGSYPGTARFNSVPPQYPLSTSAPYGNATSLRYEPSFINPNEEEGLFSNHTHYQLASFPDVRPPPLIRSQSVPAPSNGANIRDIKLFCPGDGGSCNAVALLDTGCLTGNWISSDLVTRLGLPESDFINSGPPVTSQAANGGAVKSKGSIILDWRWSLKGVKVNTATFHVADAEHYDVIIGNEYIEQKQLLSWNADSFNPLTEHDPVISPYESEDIRQARLKQEREKADRKAKKESSRSSRATTSHHIRQ